MIAGIAGDILKNLMIGGNANLNYAERGFSESMQKCIKANILRIDTENTEVKGGKYDTNKMRG